MSVHLSSVERQNQILRFITSHQRISTAEICEKLMVSEATARRDLEILETGGKLQRVHGGAIPIGQTSKELPIHQRQSEQAGEKTRIGQAAAGLVEEGETVFLGSGTTVLEVARVLRGRRNLTIITNSLAVVNALAGEEGLTIVCLGGMLRESELSFIGHITEQALGELRADKVMIGTRAISLANGLTHEYLPETMTDRAILKVGREIIVLADHTKFGREGAVLLAPLVQVHTFITDMETPTEYLEALHQKGIKVLTV